MGRLRGMPFELTPAELHAVLWSLALSRAVIARATASGRTLPVTVTPPEELATSLQAGVLTPADQEAVLAAIRVATSLYEPASAEIRRAVEPPAREALDGAARKIAAGVSAGLKG